MSLRKHLLSTCDLHTILDMLSGMFQGEGVKTVREPNPLNDDDLKEFVRLPTGEAGDGAVMELQCGRYQQRDVRLKREEPEPARRRSAPKPGVDPFRDGEA